MVIVTAAATGLHRPHITMLTLQPPTLPSATHAYCKKRERNTITVLYKESSLCTRKRKNQDL